MPQRERDFRKEITPGEIYSGITLGQSEFEERVERKLVKRAHHPFVSYCKRLHRIAPGLGKNAKFSRKYQEAVDFLGWELKAEEFNSAVSLSFIVSLLVFVGIAVLIDLSPISQVINGFLNNELLAKAYIYLPAIIASILLTNYLQNYPLSEAEVEKTRALTFVPEIMGYMIMSMKLVPNLERAVEFAAQHGRGKIAEDFKRAIWEVQVGVHSTLAEALDKLAYRWGKFSEEFKHSLMMIRASVLENTEAKRYQMLDKTMSTILESIKNKMEDYARNLQQPSTILFYLGVLLPLILIIILPVGSAFSGQPLAMTPVLILIYNIIIPAVVLLYARSVIRQRPPTYDPPHIPENYPGLPKKGNMILGKSQLPIVFAIIAVLLVGTGFSFLLSAEGFPPKSVVGKEFFQLIPHDKTKAEVLEKIQKPETYYDDGGGFFREQLQRGENEETAKKKTIIARQEFFSQPENDVMPLALVFGLMLTVSVCIFIYLYYTFIYRRKVQEEIMKLETEFKDSLYILASRLGENKPVEEALRHTKDFLPGLAVSSRVFGKTVENIELLGMPLEAAVFDPNYVSMRNIPSSIIRGSMKLLIDSVQLGVNLAARTLISLSLQLSNAEKVTRMLSVLVSDVTSTMKTMVVFVAPIVLGITVALQRIVMRTLSSVAGSGIAQSAPSALQQQAVLEAGIEVPSLTGIDVNVFASLVTPLEFVIIVALYLIEIVIVMWYFTTKIEEDNNILVWVNIAKALPVAMIIFLLSVITANALVAGFFG